MSKKIELSYLWLFGAVVLTLAWIVGKFLLGMIGGAL